MTKRRLPVTARQLRDYSIAMLHELVEINMAVVRRAEDLLSDDPENDIDLNSANGHLFKALPLLAKLPTTNDRVNIMQFLHLHPDSTTAERVRNVANAVLVGQLSLEEGKAGADMLNKELDAEQVALLKEFLENHLEPPEVVTADATVRPGLLQETTH